MSHQTTSPELITTASTKGGGRLAALSCSVDGCFFCAGEKEACDCGAFDEIPPETPMTKEVEMRIEANQRRREIERELNKDKCHKKRWNHISCHTMKTQCGGHCHDCPKKTQNVQIDTSHTEKS